jgi:hypothetical protein
MLPGIISFFNKAVHPTSIMSVLLSYLAASSRQETLRHMRLSAYRCYLPVLTGLGSHSLRRTQTINAACQTRNKKTITSVREFDPAIADCRLQGTASSPSSTA